MSPLSPEWLPFLRKVFFFSSFTEEDLGHILGKMSVLSLPKGAVLFRQGDPGDALYLIHSGRMRLTQSEKNQEKITAYLGRGDALGEMAILTGEPRPNTAVAEATLELLVLYKSDFEDLLRDIPSLALPISRVLSHRLLETTRSKTTGVSASRLHPIISHAPLADRIVFAVNLGVCLVEQTHRKVLLLDIQDQDISVYAKSLGLEPVRIGESSLSPRDLQNPDTIQKLAVFHPSGLELMSLPLSLVEKKLFSSIYPFLAELKKIYDFTLIVMPPKMSPTLKAVLEESDSVLFVEKDSATPGEEEIRREITAIIPESRIHSVQLAENGLVSASGLSKFRVPWRASIGFERMEARTPFLAPSDFRAQRFLERLARQLGGLRIGFAMGSGASMGYAMIGMLKVLEKNGIFPDVIAGTSMGALIGSFYAAGKTPDELEEIALSITKRKLLTLTDVTIPWQGLILGRQVLKFLKSILGEVTFEELPTPLACVATDIMTGEEVVIKQGKVAEAVRGSLSLPFFFQPFFYQGRFLVDGGLVNPVPTATVAAMGADILLSANLTVKPTNKRFLRRNGRRTSSSFWKGPNIVEVMAKTIYTMQFGIAQSQAELAHVVLAPDLSGFTWAEFYRSSDIIKVGETYMEEALPKVKTLLPVFADYCQVPIRRAFPFRSY